MHTLNSYLDLLRHFTFLVMLPIHIPCVKCMYNILTCTETHTPYLESFFKLLYTENGELCKGSFNVLLFTLVQISCKGGVFLIKYT